MSKKKATREKLNWIIGERAFECRVLPNRCSKCKKAGTLVGLPEPELKKQPDDTNVVCHPGIDGCNHGFHIDAPPESLYREIFIRRPKR